ncbi:MAG: hypothetical protein M3P04_07600 [Actinomycetota bacterium]|nr:hypothetical protein [Actinomycetota bacterium]
MRRTRLVFAHRSDAQDVVLTALRARGQVVQATAADVPQSVEPGHRLLITEVEALSQQRHGSGIGLGALREGVHALLETGIEICLVSALPRLGYPPTPGSSLLGDAHVFQLDSCRRILVERGVEGAADLDRAPDDPEALRRALLGLGLDALSALDRLIFELGATRDLQVSLLAPLEWEALRGVGIVDLDPETDRHVVRTPLSLLMPVLSDVIAENLAVQHDLAAVVVALTEIERRLRRAARDKAVTVHGEKWRGQLFNQKLNEDVLARAAADAYAPPPSVKALRDPFEWLSLGELLDVLRHAGWCDRLGLEDRYWRRLGEEVLPVRNRVGHMRLLRRGDLDTVRTWCAALSRVLR